MVGYRRFPRESRTTPVTTADLSDDDHGTTVVRGTERIGTVTDVRSGTASVESDWNEVPADVMQRLDWDRSDDQYTTPASAFSGVQEDAT